MTNEKDKQQNDLSNLISPSLKREKLVNLIKDRLTYDEFLNLGFNAKEAADKIVESFSYLGVFAPEPSTFDKASFLFTGAFDMDDEAANTAWNVLLRIGLLKEEPEVGRDRVSIDQKTIDMLQNTSNGYLTED